MVLRLRIQFCMTIFGSSLLYLAMSVIEIKSSCVPSLNANLHSKCCDAPINLFVHPRPFQTKIRQISHCQPSFRIEHMFVLIILETNMCSSLDLYFNGEKCEEPAALWLRPPQKLASQNVTEPPTHSGRPPNAKAPRGLFRTYRGASAAGTAHPVRCPSCWPAADGDGLAGRCSAAAATCLRRRLPRRRQPQLLCGGSGPRRPPRRQPPARRRNPARSQPRGWTRPRRPRRTSRTRTTPQSAALPLLVASPPLAAPSSAAASAAAAASPEAATRLSPFKMACAAAGSSPPPLAGSEPATRSTSQFVDQVWSHTPLKMPAAMVRASQPMVT